MGGADFPVIQAINRSVVHKICSGQVILDLASAVKELVENSLDAGATSIEINLKECGEEYFKVIDNGCGISPDNFQALALKHHTSKIADFSDLHSLTTFGFRGEALSSLCALGSLTVETRTKNEQVGTHLTFDHSGLVTGERKIARQVGTTVTVGSLFSTLPVRSKEFKRNIRRDYAKLISLLNAYALIAKGVRLLCTNTNGKNLKSVVLKSQGSSSLKDNVVTVLGLDTFQCLEPLNLCISEGCKVEGFISKSGYGSGRNSGDRQFFYINSRPVDMPKVCKLVNELYKCSNSKQYPVAIMNFLVPTTSYDVNITPDKRKIFLSDEGSLMLSLREAVKQIYSPSERGYSINKIKEPKQGGDLVLDTSLSFLDDENFVVASEALSPECDGEKGASCKHKIRVDAVSSMVMQETDELELDTSQCFRDNEDSSLASEALSAAFDGQREVSFRHDLSNKVMQVHGQSPCKEKGTTNGDVNSLSMDLTSNMEEVDRSEIFSAFKYKQSADLFNPVVKNVDNTLESARSLKKDYSSRPNLVQSSLTKFVSTAMKKRKHESSSSLLSEVSVLRNETSSFQVRKTLSEMHATISKFVSGNDTKDEPSILQKDAKHDQPASVRICSDLSGQSDVSISADVLTSIGYDVSAEESTLVTSDKQDLSCTVATPEASRDLHMISGITSMSESCDTAPNILKPCTAPTKLSPLQFNMTVLRARRLRKLLGSCSFKSTCIRSRNMSCYNAATLDNSQPENDAGKAKSLAAATSELERFFKKEDFGRMQVVGQFNLGFIIGKLDNDLFIIDQHAADEKHNFETLSRTTILNQQPLLRPIRLQLSPEEEVITSMHMEIIRKNGFSLLEDMHAPPGHHFLLKAAPFSGNVAFGAEDLKELISTLADSQGECSIISSYKMDTQDSICPSRVRAMLASRACRTSTMIGDPLDKNEMRRIVHNLAKLKSPWNCPHGRPTMRHLADLSAIRQTRLEEE